MTNIFDTHAHYSSRQFDADRDAVMRALGEGGVVGVLECATHSGDAAAVLELAHKYPFVHAALGIHPESLGEEDAATVATYHGDWRAELAAMRPLFDDPAVIAVGEIGLDHHWPLPAQEQYDLFEAQLQLAQELDLPVSVHDREAHAEMYELLRQYRPRGVLHCYSGSAEDAAWLTAQGMALGFGGAVTYKGAKRAAKVLAMVPHELAVLETDCPYMSPEPVRGTRNDSRNIAHVAAKIGEIWQMDAQSVLDLTAENAKRILQSIRQRCTKLCSLCRKQFIWRNHHESTHSQTPRIYHRLPERGFSGKGRRRLGEADRPAGRLQEGP